MYRVMKTMKLHPALLTMFLFILTCFCPPSCGHIFSDSSSMLELQSQSTMSFVTAISDYVMTQQFTHWSSYTSWCSHSRATMRIQHQNSNAYHSLLATSTSAPRIFTGKASPGSSHLYWQHGESKGNQKWQHHLHGDWWLLWNQI